MTREEQAVELFKSGYSCSQAVLAAFSEEFGLSRDMAFRIAGPFRAGMGRMGRTCGAVTGGFMVLGLKFGGGSPAEPEKRDRICALVQELDREFARRNGSCICSTLVGHDVSSPEERAKAFEEGVFRTLCPRLVQDAVEIVGEMIDRE